MFMNEYLLYMGFVGIILLALYLYMYKRIVVLVDEQKRGVYAPQLLKSLIEIFVFLAVYFGAGVVATLPNINLDVAASATIGAFILSLLVINKKVYNKFGKFTVPFATGIVTLFYSLMAYLSSIMI